MNISYKIRSLIYGSVFIALIEDVGSVIGVRVGVTKVRNITQQGEVYINKEHRKAGSERNKRQDLL